MLFTALITIPSAWLIYGNHQQEQDRKDITVSSQGYPKNKGENMSWNQIAIGTTGQGTYLGSGCDIETNTDWIVSTGSFPQPTADNPQGWGVSSSGVITVPTNAPLGNIPVTLYSSGEDCEDPMFPTKYESYGIEVVCDGIIPRGTTGQACFSEEICTVTQWEQPQWEIIGDTIYNDTNPNGWNMTSDGMITVPSNPILSPAESYYAYWYEQDTDECQNPEMPVRMTVYTFTVPCVSIELTATRIDVPPTP